MEVRAMANPGRRALARRASAGRGGAREACALRAAGCALARCLAGARTAVRRRLLEASVSARCVSARHALAHVCAKAPRQRPPLSVHALEPRVCTVRVGRVGLRGAGRVEQVQGGEETPRLHPTRGCGQQRSPRRLLSGSFSQALFFFSPAQS
ncbi:unnamed protein product [Prorocentrum cordatum]|uniref:Uncharacterized protein n=1 Tax=Prorocentrum cordatum TaxID=2364126 RepID=A0ABN9X0R5_9DINO|nr:unnamed protein product [Polarella glacialis]